MLRPGGVALFAEVDTTPFTDKKHRIQPGVRGGAPGWTDYWEQVRQAFGQLGVDVGIPARLRSCVRDTREFESIVAQEALVPIGFWPKGTFRFHLVVMFASRQVRRRGKEVKSDPSE